MTKYDFEFNDTKFAFRLFMICLITFIALLFITLQLNLNFLILITISLGIPILIFWLNRKKIPKKGFATISDCEIEFNLNGAEEKINLNEIKNYQIHIYNGTTLNIKLKSGKKIGIVSNSNFCNPMKFDVFCQELENKIEKYKTENNIELIRKKSFFEQVWLFPFLVIITSILIISVLIAVFKGMELKPSIFISLAPLSTLWGGYLSTKNRMKNKI
ncbi:hypothetical protein SAMN05660845_0864 [Flavobacterium swingsii]|uniref:Uncharacterized protein n=1 Tax=Flavobacterium swingsii TaxID=498292 RepID=A0A1I0WNR8_9FLAO|nr:hypothetical protein [Flavobacterium swingsii]SFA89810.1 hypothetical protein SAMN05660845_0864 [Flavobacterium swingsii]